MEKYVAAAERIAARAIAADPLPKPIEAMYQNKDKKIRRIDTSTIEANAHLDCDGDYTVRFALPGERATNAKPVPVNPLDGWQSDRLHDGRDQAVRTGLLQSLLRRKNSASSCPKATTSFASASSMTTSSRP